MRVLNSPMGGAPKHAIRESALDARRALDRAQVRSLSDMIQKRLFSLDEFKAAKVVATYVSMKDEVQTDDIIRTSLRLTKKVLVPFVDTSRLNLIFSEVKDLSELHEGYYGIREPQSQFLRVTPLEEANLILVPLVAWDERGYRIGHGKGYFDKALGSLKKDILTVGLAFESQRVDRVPDERLDIPMKLIVTEARLLRFKASEKLDA